MEEKSRPGDQLLYKAFIEGQLWVGSEGLCAPPLLLMEDLKEEESSFVVQ